MPTTGPTGSQPTNPINPMTAEKAMIRAHAFSENIDLTNLKASEISPNVAGLLRQLGSQEVKGLEDRANIQPVGGDTNVATSKFLFKNKKAQPQLKMLQKTNTSPTQAAPAA